MLDNQVVRVAGFEPTRGPLYQGSVPAGIQGRCVYRFRHTRIERTEREGFEPSVRSRRTPDFESGAFNLALPPLQTGRAAFGRLAFINQSLSAHCPPDKRRIGEPAPPLAPNSVALMLRSGFRSPKSYPRACALLARSSSVCEFPSDRIAVSTSTRSAGFRASSRESCSRRIANPSTRRMLSIPSMACARSLRRLCLLLSSCSSLVFSETRACLFCLNSVMRSVIGMANGLMDGPLYDFTKYGVNWMGQ